VRYPAFVSDYEARYVDGLAGPDSLAWDTYASTLTGGNFRFRNSFSCKRFYTAAPSITVELYSTQGTYPGIGVVDVYANGAFVQSVAGTLNAKTTTVVNLPSAGTQQLVEVFDSENNAGLIAACLRAWVPAGYSMSKIAPSAPSWRLVCAGDSILSGVIYDGSSYGDCRRYGVSGLLRDSFPGRVANVGYGGDSLFNEYTAGVNSIVPLATQINALADGTTRNDLILNFGHNDPGAGWSSQAQFQAQYQALISAVAPHFTNVWVWGILVASSDYSGWNAVIQAALTGAAPPNGTYVNTQAAGWPVIGDMLDGAHPTPAGSVKMHTMTRALLGF
jgi:hypothetical protein